MTIFTITGNDTLTIFNRVFNDIADGSVIDFTFANNIADSRTGKNKNTVISKDERGGNAEMTLRVMRGSSDDQFLIAQMASQESDFASFALAGGQFVKRLGDGQGNVRRDVLGLSGGFFLKQVPVKNDTNGDPEQGVAVYTMRFSATSRSIQ